MTPTVESPANEFEIPHHRNLKTIKVLDIVKEKIMEP
jgi:hypothetical protein